MAPLARSSAKTARPRDPAFTLALMLWALVLVAHLLFTVSVRADPQLLVLPFFWVSMGLCLTWLLHQLMRRTEGLAAWQRWGVVSGAVIGFAVVQAVLNIRVANFLLEHFLSARTDSALLVRSPGGDVQVGIQIGLMIYTWVYGCYAVASGLLASQRRLSELRWAAQQAELKALRLQLHPHFLFNALNSLSALIVTDRKAEADAAALSLAAFMRTALAVDLSAPVRLGDELEAVKAYLDVERLRFGDRLEVDIEAPEALLDRCIPVFLLQPLVENAVKYGVAVSDRPVRIGISAESVGDQLRLTVTDNGPGHAGSIPGTGTGLRNIRERLSALFGDRARLEVQELAPGYAARVVVPA